MSRNNELNLEAWVLFTQGVSKIQIESDLTSKYLDAGLSINEIRKTIASAERAKPETVNQKKTITYPNVGIINSLWDSGHRLCNQPASFHHMSAMSYLLNRGLNIKTLGLDDSARITPTWYHQLAWPRWLTWNWCIMVRMWDANLQLRNFQCRSIYPDTKPKVRSPAGYSTKNLVLSHRRSIGFLESSLAETLYVVEGLPDLLKIIIELHHHRTLEPWAVVGVASGFGNWFDTFPTGRIRNAIILPHQDNAGIAYANRIYHSLTRRGIPTKTGEY